jgi:hypothetical protein
MDRVILLKCFLSLSLSLYTNTKNCISEHMRLKYSVHIASCFMGCLLLVPSSQVVDMLSRERARLFRLGLRDLHGLEVLTLAALGLDLPDDG